MSETNIRDKGTLCKKKNKNKNPTLFSPKEQKKQWRKRCPAGKGKCPGSIDQTRDWGNDLNPAARPYLTIR